jgi:quercetin dioxygenase-like cupin family protein
MIVKSAEATRRVFMGISFDVLSVGQDTMVTRMRYRAGDRVPSHRHPNEQAGYVVSGQVRIQFAEHDEILQAGDSYCIPRNVDHTFDALTAGEVIDVFCPPRQDYLA